MVAWKHEFATERAKIVGQYEQTGNTQQFYLLMGNLEAREEKVDSVKLKLRSGQRRLKHANF